MRTTTIRATTTRFASSARESGQTVFTMDAVVSAYLACRRRKRKTRNAQRYEIDLLDQLVNTVHALSERTWRPSRTIAFVVRHPKAREILAADFADRVVHHLLVPLLEHQFEPVFIHDCYSNRQGKGTHAAVDRLQSFMARPDLGMTAHYLQLDVANFFNSINRRRLFLLVQARLMRDQRRPVKDPRYLCPAHADDILWLTRVLLTGNAAQNCITRGHPAEFARVPEHKRLINAPPETGLPIGNLTSQFFANVYLNLLDQFVKHTLKCQYYVRYVDDMVLLHDDPSVLAGWREQIAQFLAQHLDLGLRDAGRLQLISNGIDFLGYVQRPNYRLIRRRVVANLHSKLDHYERQIAPRQGLHRQMNLPGVAITPDQLQTWQLPADPQPLFSTLASYLGHFGHASSHRLVASLWRRYPWLAWVVRLNANGKLQSTRSARGVASMRGQWRYFRNRFAPAIVLMQVGKCLEVYGPHARLVAGLPHHGGKPVQRPGWAATEAGLSWPMARLHRVTHKLSKQGLPWVYVAEQGWLKGGIKQRSLHTLHL